MFFITKKISAFNRMFPFFLENDFINFVHKAAISRVTLGRAFFRKGKFMNFFYGTTAFLLLSTRFLKKIVTLANQAFSKSFRF